MHSVKVCRGVGLAIFLVVHLIGLPCLLVDIDVVTRSMRAVRVRYRLSTSIRKKLGYLVEIPTVLDVGPFTKVGQRFGGKSSCVRLSLSARTIVSVFVYCRTITGHLERP